MAEHDHFHEAQRSLLDLATSMADYLRRDEPGEWDKAVYLVSTMSTEQKDLVVTTQLLSMARAVIRRDTLAAERTAERKAREGRPSWASTTEDLYLGRYRHGSMDQRKGAVLRGCDCERCTEAREREAALEARLHENLHRAVEQHAREVRLEYTRELLASTFRIGGQDVTWGAASIDQHRARLAMFLGNVQANAEGAARHQRAIEDIEAAGVACLNELVGSEQ